MELTNIKDIQTLLGRHGFRFSKSMGQNFLTAAWVPQRIAEESGIGPEEGMIVRVYLQPSSQLLHCLNRLCPGKVFTHADLI